MIKAKRSVTALAPYINGHHNQKLIKNHRKVLKLDSNESTIAPSPKVIAAIMQYLQEGPINWYPDIESTVLRSKLSQYTHIPKKYILTFNGSDHALETIARTFLSTNDDVIYFQPTYDHFRVYAESSDAVMVPAFEDSEVSFLDNLEHVITPRTKMVYLVNPNNPTGHLIDSDQIEEAITHYPHILFVIDEAYYEFCDTTASSLVLWNKNIIVTRSFSKAFGLAGLRCGYLMAHPNLCHQIAKIRVGKNINAVAQIAATASLNDLAYMRRYTLEVNASKRWLSHQLQGLGLNVKETPANFILVQVNEPAKVIRYLEEHDIHIRDRSNMPQLKGMIRITVGDQLAMKRFFKIFETTPQEWLVQVKPSEFQNLTKQQSL